MQKEWLGCKVESSELSELRIVVDTGVFCASLGKNSQFRSTLHSSSFGNQGRPCKERS